MAIRAYKVPIELNGQRIDVVLSKLDPQYSRSSWQKLISDSRIRLDGKTVRDPAIKVNAELIEFDPPDKIPPPAEGLPVIYEDKSVIVFNKPAGILTHAKGQLPNEWTVADVLKPLTSDKSGTRAGIVHRLDRGTSGVLIAAKTEEAKKFLQNQFSKRSVTKVYKALVEGVVEPEQITLNWPIARNPLKPATFIVNASGKTAETDVKVIKRAAFQTLVELMPKTGRTHQLRVHMKQFGHPIVGDDIYGNNTDGRMWLHAYSLSLLIPEYGTKTFVADLPKDWPQPK